MTVKPVRSPGATHCALAVRAPTRRTSAARQIASRAEAIWVFITDLNPSSAGGAAAAILFSAPRASRTVLDDARVFRSWRALGSSDAAPESAAPLRAVSCVVSHASAATQQRCATRAKSARQSSPRRGLAPVQLCPRA